MLVMLKGHLYIVRRRGLQYRVRERMEMQFREHIGA